VDGERCGEGRGEKGRGCAPKVEGDERGKGVNKYMFQECSYTSWRGGYDVDCTMKGAGFASMSVHPGRWLFANKLL